MLDLPEKQEQEQAKVVTAVKQWLTTHDQWLLIFDNADDLAVADEYIPTKITGHLLLTTRHQQPGAFPNGLDIDTMNREEGALLVLRRAHLLAPDASLEAANPADCEQAEQIVTAMGGLPLALDQAAAYIEETGCRLVDYLARYKQKQADLLRRRGGSSHDASQNKNRGTTLYPMRRKSYATPNSLCHIVYFHYINLVER